MSSQVAFIYLFLFMDVNKDFKNNVYEILKNIDTFKYAKLNITTEGYDLNGLYHAYHYGSKQ